MHAAQQTRGKMLPTGVGSVLGSMVGSIGARHEIGPRNVSGSGARHDFARRPTTGFAGAESAGRAPCALPAGSIGAAQAARSSACLPRSDAGGHAARMADDLAAHQAQLDAAFARGDLVEWEYRLQTNRARNRAGRGEPIEPLRTVSDAAARAEQHRRDVARSQSLPKPRRRGFW